MTQSANHPDHGRTAAPHPDDERKPSSPTEMTKPTTGYVLKRAASEFTKDKCTDLAAALTYYAVLALFPALLALVSLLGILGQNASVLDAFQQVITDLLPSSTAQTINGFIENQTTTAGLSLSVVIGLAGSLWSASGYVGAFSRAMNDVYEVEEGRPFYKLRPVMLVITLVALLLVVAALLILVLSGPVAQSIGDVLGLGAAAVTAWQIAKWPVLLLVVVLVVAMLYYATPNVQQPKFRWMSLGAFIAIAVWMLASVALAVYVANFGNYGAKYGALASAVVLLLWLWITNLALLFGAEVDAEVERGRELQAGMPAEDTVQLPPRDTTASDKKATKRRQVVEQGRRLRRRGEGD
ncbi:YihY/virulence factor BrkB family protein [uncultured Pseudokineococcus sp.]|uniref:YihY/virulence factor BrkB family protein n=1 Tax=uncultured Pseudokineococcus sp. TaxID=1642928 RepID=UPI00260B41FA|nr:YihY/virulence factor BrkB family protein [uncultured Pseudokineococcus sp.]